MVTVPASAGEISVDDLGVVLMHEHVFIRTESLQRGWPGFGGWDEEAEVAAARDRLSQLKRGDPPRPGPADWTGPEIDKVMPDWQYTYIHHGLLPGLRDRGVPDEEIEQMLVRNPREFFAQGRGGPVKG